MKYETGRDTREKILIAAWKLFLAKGYDGATYDDIARTAHVSRGSIHYHFKTKEAIRNAEIARDIHSNLEIAQRYASGEQYIAILSTSIFWYKFLHDERYRQFYLPLANQKISTSTEDVADEDLYFRFLCSAFETELPMKEFQTGGQLVRRLAIDIDSIIMACIAASPGDYDHFSATKSEFKLIARVLNVSATHFEEIWSRAFSSLKNFPYDEIRG